MGSEIEAEKKAAAKKILSPKHLLLAVPLVSLVGRPILPSQALPCPPRPSSPTSPPSTKLHHSSGALTRRGRRRCPPTPWTPSPFPPHWSPPSPPNSSSCPPMRTPPRGRCSDSGAPRDPTILVSQPLYSSCQMLNIINNLSNIYNLYQVLVNFSSYQVTLHIFSSLQLCANVRII